MNSNIQSVADSVEQKHVSKLLWVAAPRDTRISLFEVSY